MGPGKRTSAQKVIINTIYPAVVFFAVSMPFRMLFRVMEVTEMRPASALPPVFGLMLGLPGVFGCTLGNLAADIVSGYSLPVCILGFVAQFIYGALPLLMWNIIRRFDAKEPPFFTLSSVKNVIRYILMITANSLVMAGLLGLIIQVLDISTVFSRVTLMMLLNNFVFCMVLGIPILIFMSIGKYAGRQIRLSLNERLVLFFLSLGVISSGLIGVFAYMELADVIADPLTMWNRIYLYITVDLFIFYIIMLAFLRYSEKNIALPIESIADIATNYISGGIEKKDSEGIAAECSKFTGNKNETGILAEAFKTMVLDLDTYIDYLTMVTAERERIHAELSVAAKIQASLLPCVFPPFPDRDEFDIFASMLPAREVGGDFYDFFLVDDNKLAVIIADVSGKGVPAALFMVVAKVLIKGYASDSKNPKEVFEIVNRILCENNDACMFVTAFMGYLDLQSGRFVYVNAGHNPPFLKKRGGDFSFLKVTPSFVLAGLETTEYSEEEAALDSGDILFLYTDGVTEAMNDKKELFTNLRLLEALNQHKEQSAKDLLGSVKKEIDRFAGGAEQSDDITMLALEILHRNKK